MNLSCHFVFPNVELFLVLPRSYFCVLAAAYVLRHVQRTRKCIRRFYFGIGDIIYFVVELSKYVYKLCGQLILDITVGVC